MSKNAEDLFVIRPTNNEQNEYIITVGNAGGAFVLSISRQGVIYVLALFIMSNVFGYTGVLVSQACSDVVTALIAAVIMLKIMKKLTNKNE